MTVAETERLLLRRLTESDADAFAAINADPLVMRFLGGPLDRAGSDALLHRSMSWWDEHGYGRAAVVLEETGALLGFTGLGAHRAAPGEVEIGWRLASWAWGNGYATEAAAAVRDLAFSAWGLDKIVSVARSDNDASVAVMRRIGMTFDRGVVLDGETLVVYAVTRQNGWPAGSA